MKNEQFTISPIGYIRFGNEGPYLEIKQEYRKALTELKGFSYIQVLFWCHLVDEPGCRSQTTCEKPYKKSPATVGIFATRSPVRPNPIALTPVAALDIDLDKGIIRIPFIDAEDGTPVVDIKPYTPCIDRVKEVTTPDWNSHWPQYYEDSAHFDWAAEFVNAQ